MSEGGKFIVKKVKHRWLLLHLIFAFSNQCLTAILCSQPPPLTKWYKCLWSFYCYRVDSGNVQWNLVFLCPHRSLSTDPPLVTEVTGEEEEGCDKSMMIWRANIRESNEIVFHIWNCMGTFWRMNDKRSCMDSSEKNPIFSLLSNIAKIVLLQILWDLAGWVHCLI